MKGAEQHLTLNLDTAYKTATREYPQSTVALYSLLGYAILSNGHADEIFNMPSPSEYNGINQNIFREAVTNTNRAHRNLGIPYVITEEDSRDIMNLTTDNITKILSGIAESMEISTSALLQNKPYQGILLGLFQASAEAVLSPKGKKIAKKFLTNMSYINKNSEQKEVDRSRTTQEYRNDLSRLTRRNVKSRIRNIAPVIDLRKPQKSLQLFSIRRDLTNMFLSDFIV